MVERFPTKMTKTGHLCFCSTPLCLGVGVHAQAKTPLPRQRHLRLGKPEVKFYELSGQPRRSMPRLGVAKLHLGVLVSYVLVPLFC